MIRLMIMAVIAVIVTGCGTTASTKLDVAVAKRGAFEFRDERPGNNRISAKTVQYGGETTTIGDDAIQPDPVA